MELSDAMSSELQTSIAEMNRLATEVDDGHCGCMGSVAAEAAGYLGWAAAELARVTAERDKLIEAWPGDIEGERLPPMAVYKRFMGWVASSTSRYFNTRTEAVRFAAGLDEPKGAPE